MDGRFDTGDKIVDFRVYPDDPYTPADDVVGVLATEASAATEDWNLGDQRQVAWASVDIRTGGFAPPNAATAFGRELIPPLRAAVEQRDAVSSPR